MRPRGWNTRWFLLSPWRKGHWLRGGESMRQKNRRRNEGGPMWVLREECAAASSCAPTGVHSLGRATVPSRRVSWRIFRWSWSQVQGSTRANQGVFARIRLRVTTGATPGTRTITTRIRAPHEIAGVHLAVASLATLAATQRLPSGHHARAHILRRRFHLPGQRHRRRRHQRPRGSNISLAIRYGTTYSVGVSS